MDRRGHCLRKVTAKDKFKSVRWIKETQTGQKEWKALGPIEIIDSKLGSVHINIL